MKRIFNYNTGKLYESDGTYTITVFERPLSSQVVVEPGDENVEFEQKFLSYDEALDAVDNAVDNLCDSEGFNRDDVDIKETENGFIVSVPDYKEWEFVISGDVDESLNEFMAGGTDYQRTFADFERYVKVIPEFREIFRDLHTLGQWNEGIFKVSQGEKVKGFEGVKKDYAEWLLSKLSKVIRLLSNRSMDSNNPDNHYKIKVSDLKELLNDLKQLATISWLDAPIGVRTIKSAAGRAYEAIKNLKEESNNESVSSKFSRLRTMFEAAGLNESDEEEDEKKDDKKSEDEPKDDEKKDNEDKKDDEKSDDEDSDDSQEMKAVIITVKKGDEDKCKDELIEAGVDEDDIDILENDDEDAENVEIRIDVNSVMELKDYLEKKGIDLEEEIGGEIVDDSDEDEESSDDEEKKDDEEGDEEGDFDFNDLGDLFGADDSEE